MNDVNDQGPIQPSQRARNGVDRAREIASCGIGRAFVDRIRLPSQPGPHQRSGYPADTIQPPRSTLKYEPSGRKVSPSAGSHTRVAFKRTAKRSLLQLKPTPIPASSRGVSSNVRITRGSSATETRPYGVIFPVLFSRSDRASTRR